MSLNQVKLLQVDSPGQRCGHNAAAAAESVAVSSAGSEQTDPEGRVTG